MVVLATFTVEVELESRNSIHLCSNDQHGYGESDGCIRSGPACRVLYHVVVMAALLTFHFFLGLFAPGQG